MVVMETLAGLDGGLESLEGVEQMVLEVYGILEPKATSWL